eukprot:3318522-Amphidinium_carterae.1
MVQLWHRWTRPSNDTGLDVSKTDDSNIGNSLRQKLLSLGSSRGNISVVVPSTLAFHDVHWVSLVGPRWRSHKIGDSPERAFDASQPVESQM